MFQKLAQHYRYNAEILTITKEDEEYFVSHFSPEKEPATMHWLNFHSMEDKESLTRLCDYLGVDKLIQEDLFTGTKRPRLEEYEGYIFFSILSALPTKASEFDLKKERISFLMGKNYLISFQEKSSDHFPEVRERLELKKGKLRFKGPDFLLYRMLEAIVDNYYEVLDEIAVTTDALESLVIRYPKSDILRRIEWQKRKLVQMERIESPMFLEDNRHYFQDLKDSCVGAIEEIDSQKLILEGLINLYYAAQGQKMNEIMKVLTIISAVFIPLTFIVGVYGMNFEYMPELEWKNGYWFAWGLMILVAIGMTVVFWRRGWLRRNK
jgi:magnesium transporter